MHFDDIEEKVDTAFGKVKVSIYGDRSLHPIVTFHDIGLDSENNFLNFFQFGTIVQLADKFCVYSINAPGQEMDARPLPDNYVYPSMDGLAQIVSSVVEHFGFKMFIGFGIGAGANVMLRYALNHPQKLDALILINACITRAGWIEWGYQKVNLQMLRSSGTVSSFTIDYLIWHHLGKRLDECNQDIVRQYRQFFQNHPNPANMAAFIESYLNRSDITLLDRNCVKPFLLEVPVLQLVGARSAFVEDTVYVNSQMDPACSDYLKISDACGLVLDDKPESVTQAMVLFLQGQGYFASLNVHDVIRKLTNVRLGESQDGEAEEISVRRVNEVVHE